MPPPSEAFLAAAAPRQRRSTTPARRRALGYALLILPVLLATLVLFVYPIGQILTTSVVDRGLTLANYRRALGDPIYLRVLWITVKISLLTTLVCLLLGYPMAYLIAQAPPRPPGTLVAVGGGSVFMSPPLANYA